jgi:asparagine synthetase B (glutamine-hydrolysing)
LNLILIDKTLDDTSKEEQKVLNLIYPKMTHMDFNISTALHLASKGEGYLYSENEKEKIFVKSGARIILSGLGADEVFGGYSRYRAAYLRGELPELQNEMNFGKSSQK